MRKECPLTVSSGYICGHHRPRTYIAVFREKKLFFKALSVHFIGNEGKCRTRIRISAEEEKHLLLCAGVRIVLFYRNGNVLICKIPVHLAGHTKSCISLCSSVNISVLAFKQCTGSVVTNFIGYITRTLKKGAVALPYDLVFYLKLFSDGNFLIGNFNIRKRRKRLFTHKLNAFNVQIARICSAFALGHIYKEIICTFFNVYSILICV